MPFQAEFDPVFAAVQDAVQSAGEGQDDIRCYWLKDVHAAGRITDDILDSLNGTTLTVADVSGSNPNVMWETGFAMALGKPTILIGQHIQDLPFDLRMHRVVEYSPDSIADFGPRLSEAVRQTLQRYNLESPADEAQNGRPLSHIAVTGSFLLDPERIQKRLQEFLTPYVGSGVTWYCGGAGDADTAILRFLTARGEVVSAVVNHPLDFTDEIRELVDTKGIDIIDASTEPLPKGFSGPSERDMIMCLRADLVIIFWDGQSPVVKKLISYFKTKEKSVLVAFV